MSIPFRYAILLASATLSANVSFAAFPWGKAAPLASCGSLLFPTSEWIAQVERDPVLLGHAQTIEKFIVGYATSGTLDRAAAELEATRLLVDLRDRGELRPVLAKVVHEARKKPGFPPLPGDDGAIADQLYTMLDAELYGRGFAPGGLKTAFKPWETLAAEQTKAVAASGTSRIGSTGFLDEFWALVKSRPFFGTKARLVNDAKEALEARIRMISGARKSIWIATWAMYGDNAGNLFADLLIKKFRDGVDVRVIVDGQTSERIGYREAVQKLRDAGVPLVQWRSEKNPYFGQHRKFMVVDHESGVGESIAGGRNFGDDYLHTGTKADSPKWRDTDVLYQGEPVAENARRFQLLWNEQCDLLARKDPKGAAKYSASKIADERVNVVQKKFRTDAVTMGILDHAPNAEGEDLIYLGFLKAIEASTVSIDISNAYVILTPALKDALIRARARGVRVRIFTNSGKSIDEKIISAPILKSLEELLPSGVEVFLKNGDTLHSKFAIFDSEMTWVMSYNLHPRSLRYEGESANVTFSRRFAAKTLSDYEKDLAGADPIRQASDLGIPNSKVASLAGRYFFDQF